MAGRQTGPRCTKDECSAFDRCVIGVPGGDVATRAMCLLKLRAPAGGDVFHQGAPQIGAVILCRGVARSYYRLPEGKQVLLRLSGPGKLLSVPTGQPHAYSCRAETECWVATVEQAALRELVSQDALVGSAILELLAANNEYYVRRLVAVASRGACGRLADALSSLLGDAGKGQPYRLPVPISAKDLGEMAGCSRQTASSWLHKLEKGGVILRDERGLLVLQPDLLSAAFQG